MERAKNKKKSENYNKEYYLRKKSNSHASYEDHVFNKQIINYILRSKKSGRLLEIGCAYGYILKYAEKYFETYGMDISNYAITQAKKITKRTELKVGDVEKDLKEFIGNKKFDIVIALDVLEHLENPEKVIKLIKNHLNKGGIFIFRVPNKSSIDYHFLKLFNRLDKWHGNTDKTHVSLYSLRKWENIVKLAGFQIKLLPYFPGKKLKRRIAEKFPRLFFLPEIFYFTNSSITFFCSKSQHP